MIIIMFNSFQISNVNATDAKNNNPMLKAIKINGIDIEPTFVLNPKNWTFFY